MAKILILADDLTGAADTGVQFSQHGWQTVLVLEPGAVKEAEVLVLCSETRGLESDRAAAEGVGALLHELAAQTPLADFELIYKKIDSTLRGHPAAELAALVTALGGEQVPVLIAPAFPAQGRTTLNGRVHVHHTPLEQTSFAINGDLRTIFGASTPVLTLETIRAGEEALEAVLRGQHGAILADAECDSDLQTLAGAARRAGVHVFCGSAGLAAAWMECAGASKARAGVKKAVETRAAGGILAVVGSLHPIIAAQVEFARMRGAEVVYPAPAFYDPGPARIAATARRLDKALAKGGLTILVTGRLSIPSPSGRGQGEGSSLLPNTPLREKKRPSPCPLPGGEGIIARRLAQAAFRALTHIPNAGDWPVRGLILTGGDTARAVCRELGCTQLRLGGEVEPGIPLANMEDGRYPGLTVVTKAGGFGTEASLWRAYETLQK
jgi:uncharacterized protein YgbK (DUF1537 family)